METKETRKDLNSAILDSLRLSRIDNYNCDVVITVDGQEFNAHKCMLTALSDYFKAMFNEAGFKEKDGIVELKDVSKEAFAVLLDFMYGDLDVFVENTEEVIIEALRVADMLLLDIFKEECKIFIENNRSVLPGKCYELTLALNPNEAAKIIKIVSVFFENESLVTYDFENVSFKLAVESLEQARSQPYQTRFLRMESIFNFIFRWVYSHQPVDIKDSKTLLDLVAFEDYPMNKVAGFLNTHRSFLKQIYPKEDSFSASLSKLIRQKFVGLGEAIADLGFSLWVVEYGNGIVVVKEYDFAEKCYKKTEHLLEVEAVARFCVSGRTVYLLDNHGMMWEVNDGECHQVDLCSVLYMHAHGDFVYILTSNMAEHYKMSVFSTTSKVMLHSGDILIRNVYSQSSKIIFSCKGETYVYVNDSCFQVKTTKFQVGMDRVILSSEADDILLNELFWTEYDLINPSQRQATVVGSYWQRHNISRMYSAASLSSSSVLAVRNVYHESDQIQLVAASLRLDLVDVDPYIEFKSLGYVPLDSTISLVGVYLSPLS